MTGAITDQAYWDGTYVGRDQATKINLSDYRNRCEAQIFGLIRQYFTRGSLIEIGAGGSDWLVNLAAVLPVERCVGLDYSPAGCRSLQAKVDASGAPVEVVCGDLFTPQAGLEKAFDIAVSFGVVEHFEDLPGVLAAKARYVRSGGLMFTLIPNMAGICGQLTKRWNRAVYDLHIPHDLRAFERAHAAIGLPIEWSGYLCSSNFGVLSSCFPDRKGWGFQVYKQLSRVSKLGWWLETRLLALPTSRIFSPYIVVVSRVGEARE